jgi:hypothetical protein
MTPIYVVITSLYDNGTSYKRLDEANFPLGEEEAMVKYAQGKVGSEVSVLIRPLFNENTQLGDCFFREWLSLNGSGFELRRWAINIAYCERPSADAAAKALEKY